MPHRALPAAIVAAVLTVLVALVGVSPRVAARAAAAGAQRVETFAGYSVEGGRDFVGAYRTTGAGTTVILYCPNPRAATPRAVRLTPTDALRIDTPAGPIAVAAVTQWRIAYLLDTYGQVRGTTSGERVRAAAVSQAMNTLLGNLADVRRRARELPAAVVRLTAQLLSTTLAYAGPYRIRFGAHPALAVGQSYLTSVALVAHSGKAVPGQRFVFIARGAAVPASAVAGRSGTAQLRYEVTDPGGVRIDARAVNTVPLTLLVSPLTRGVQRLIGTGRRASTQAGFAFRKPISAASVHYACTTVCDGRPSETVVNCTEAGTAAARFTVLDNDVAIASASTNRSSQRTCVTTPVQVADGHRLAVTVRYLVSGHWTAAVAAGAPIGIDCPPPPVVSLTQTCSCNNGELLATLANTSDHIEAIVVDGGFTATQDGAPVSTVVAPGHTLTLRFGYGPGRPLDVSVAGAARHRTDADWNIGLASRTTVTP